MIFIFPYRDETCNAFCNYEKLIDEARQKAIQQRMKDVSKLKEAEATFAPIRDSILKDISLKVEEKRKKERETAKACHIEIHNDGETVECSLYYNDNLVMQSRMASINPETFNFPVLAKKALEDMFPHLKEER